jgi:hypothetical protein
MFSIWIGPKLPLERVPGERVVEHVYRVEQQKSSVRPVQRAGLDHAEVGDHRAEEGAVLDAAEQIVVSRIRLEDYWGARGLLMVLDQDVHGITIPDGFMIEIGHDRFQRKIALPLRLLVIFIYFSHLGPDRSGVRDQVILNPVQIFHDPRLLAVFILTLANERGDGAARAFGVLLGYRPIRFALQPANLIDGLADERRKLLAPLAQSFPFFLRQLFDLFRAHWPDRISPIRAPAQ